MSKHFLRDYVTFVSGINPTRAKMENSVFYDQNDFMNDYYLDRESVINNYDKSFKLEEGDVVISLALQQAAIVSKGNHGKILTLNFIKVVFENDLLDKYYFVYLFNSYLDIKRQKERMLQGTGAVYKIPVKSLNDLEIPIISIEEQKKIGEAYFKMLYLHSCLNKYKDLTEKCVGSVPEESIKGGKQK